MSIKAPKLIFGEEISSTPPSQKIPSLNSILKLLRNEICAVGELIAIPTVSIRLSLTTAGSSMNRELGPVSGLVVDVVQSGDGPEMFAANQPAGIAGATTESKFSANIGHGVGVAVGVGVSVGVGVGVGVGPSVSVKLVLEISKKTLPTASTLMRAIVVGVPGIVTTSPPSFAVLSAKTTGKVLPPSVDRVIFTFEAFIGEI
jgi:hypothetical protein